MHEPFRHRLRVRYSECDPQGVVFNAHFLAYYDLAITEMLRDAVGGYQHMVASGADLVVAETSLRFHAPARFDDVLDLELSVTRLGDSSMLTRMDLLREGELIVQGEMRHVFIDPARHEKMTIPEAVREQLRRYEIAATGAA